MCSGVKKLLRWMSRHTQIDKIKNKYTQDKIEVTLVEEKMTKNRLRYKKSREKP